MPRGGAVGQPAARRPAPGPGEGHTINGYGDVLGDPGGREHLVQTRPSICTVSTVLDSPGNVQRFVQRNLAAGVDHMFVFLDRPQPEVSALLAGQPAVTATVTDRHYWSGKRPGNLNMRQVTNANLVRLLLAPLPWAQWLFHIDGDECLDVDRVRLLGLDASITTVQLRCLEAVSTREGSTDELFKRQLSQEDLTLLQLLGVLEAPRNADLFSGHVIGKAGIRPSLDVDLHVHRARTDEGDVVEGFEADFLRLLHYESTSFSDFRNKWGTHLDAAGPSAVRRKKADVRAAFASVVRNAALDDVRKERYLLEIYRRAVEDDVATLSDLGFLETVSPEWHSHAPEPLTDVDATSMRTLLDLLRAADKDFFLPRRKHRQPRDLLREIAGQLPESEAGLAAAVQACVAGAARPSPASQLLSRRGAPGRGPAARTAGPLQRVTTGVAAAVRPAARRLRRAVRDRRT